MFGWMSVDCPGTSIGPVDRGTCGVFGRMSVDSPGTSIGPVDWIGPVGRVVCLVGHPWIVLGHP